MGDISKRVTRLESAMYSQADEKYRHFCLCYNMRTASDEDLIELAKAIFEGRSIAEEIEERLYAPVPYSAPRHLVEEARRIADTPVNTAEYDGEKLMQMYKELLEWEQRVKEVKTFWGNNELSSTPEGD